MMIERESWRIIEFILLRYPDKKKQYAEYISNIMASSGSSAIVYDSESKPQSVTEAKAMKMTSVYADRMKKEIEAVEFVYNSLTEAEQKVIRERYWTTRARKIPYLKMKAVTYSERQCKRIVYKTIVLIGRYLGEIE